MNHDSRTYPFKFSIITAVYNVASYLSETVESILCQDIGFKESVELILVDDGSTDSSGEICDHYQALYPYNIKLMHKPNGGAASARTETTNFLQIRFLLYTTFFPLLMIRSVLYLFRYSFLKKRKTPIGSTINTGTAKIRSLI